MRGFPSYPCPDVAIGCSTPACPTRRPPSLATGFALALALASSVACAAARTPPERVVAPNPAPAPIQPIAFPRDDGPHHNLTEWWYYTGHLFDDAGGRYGFEFVVFQVVRGDYPVVYLAHVAVTDGPRGHFWHDQRGRFGAQPSAGAGVDLDVGGWRLRGADGHDAIVARADAYGLDLQLSSTKPPVLHDGTGYIHYGPVGGSYYYSRTRLAVEGTLYLADDPRAVHGQAWMDHQWGDFLVIGGWDWFSVQLDDQSELMLYVTRLPDGATGITLGTHVAADGTARALDAAAFAIVPLGTWTSPTTGAVYPSGWHVAVPELALDLTLSPTLLQQELITTATTGSAYWEGQIEVWARQTDESRVGLGYVELTGYVPPPTVAASASQAPAASAPTRDLRPRR